MSAVWMEEEEEEEERDGGGRKVPLSGWVINRAREGEIKVDNKVQSGKTLTCSRSYEGQ